MADRACHCKRHFPAEPLCAWLFAELALSCTGLVGRRCGQLMGDCQRHGCGFFRLCCGSVCGSICLTILRGIGGLFPRRIAAHRTRAILWSLMQPITRITQISEHLAAEVQQMPRRQRCQVFLIDLFQVVISQLHAVSIPKAQLNCKLKNWAGHVPYVHFKGE